VLLVQQGGCLPELCVDTRHPYIKQPAGQPMSELHNPKQLHTFVAWHHCWLRQALGADCRHNVRMNRLGMTTGVGGPVHSNHHVITRTSWPRFSQSSRGSSACPVIRSRFSFVREFNADSSVSIAAYTE
jgi:hypothetical protein